MYSADDDRDAPTSYYLSQAVATLLIPGTGLTVAEWVDRDNGPLVIGDEDPLFREWLGRLRVAATDMLVTDPYDAWPISGSVVIVRPIRDSAGREVFPPAVDRAHNSIAVLHTGIGSELPRNPSGLPSARTPRTATSEDALNVATPPDGARGGDDARLRIALWNSAIGRLNRVREEFAAYETDPTAFFHRPLLADRTHPIVQTFYTALAHADALRVDDMVPADLGYVREFADRAAAAEAAWSAAQGAASASGDSGLSADQRALLRRAESAINVALDDRTPPNERAAAYRRVIDLFGKARLNIPGSITGTLRREIEGITRRALPNHPPPTEV